MSRDDKFKKKTLTYRRAVYHGTETGMQTLEQYLVLAHEIFKDIKQRTVAMADHPVMECRNFKKHDRGRGVFLHLASYHPGEQASIVRHMQNDSSSDIETLPPPENTEFMDGDMMILVVDNHVVLCSTNVHEKNAERYMRQIIIKADIDRACGEFALHKIGNINKLALIEKQKVKSITLGASIYDATLSHEKRKTLSAKINGSLMDQIKAIFAKDFDQGEASNAENINARIVLTYDSRKKKAALGREDFQAMASKIIEEDDDGFTIETYGGEKIRQHEITVHKSVLLPKYGKSVFREETWRELSIYFEELKISGMLEQ